MAKKPVKKPVVKKSIVKKSIVECSEDKRCKVGGKIALSTVTLNICEELIEIHGTFTGVQKNMQVTFLKCFKSALVDVGGKHWQDNHDPDSLTETFKNAKRLVWKELKVAFEAQTFRSYFTIVKKLLWYELSPKDWTFCKDTSQDILEVALPIVKDSENDDGTYCGEQHLTYEDAMRETAEQIKKEKEVEKEEGLAAEATELHHFRVPRLGGKSSAEWRNEWLLFIRRVQRHPSVEPMMDDDDPQAKVMRQILKSVNGVVKEKKNNKHDAA